MSDAPHLGIVTPEAVILELPSAGIASRMLAKLVDLVVVAMAVVIGMLVIGSVLGGTGGEVVAVLWISFCVLGTPIVAEGVWNGRTPGKAVMGLRAVALDGGPLQWRQAILRGVCQPLDLFFGLGILPALLTRRSQRFGDLLAGTFVLVDRVTDQSARPIAFLPPPGWEQYVYTLDVGRIRPEQYRLIRQFLLRVTDLEPGARWHLSVQLADAARARVSPQPPGMVQPELFLVCVASAYQHRNGGIPRPDQIIGHLPR